MRILAVILTSAEVDAIRLSLLVSVAATGLILPPGILLGTWLARTGSRVQTVVEIVVMAPLVIPPVVTGWLLLSLLSWFRIPFAFTWQAAALASGVVALPLLVRTVRTAVENRDGRLEHVAATLGASRPRVFLTITLPLAWRGILGGTLLAWARGIGEFGATIVVAGNTPGRTQTIPAAIWSGLQSSQQTGAVWRLTAAAVALSVAAIAVSQLLVGRRPRATVGAARDPWSS